MAHSLFEPAPAPLSEKLWRRMIGIGTGRAPHAAQVHGAIEQTDPVLLQQAANLDARGRQQLLEAVLTAKPIAKQKPRA
ncbi:hypothetical protein [Roseibium salinum]|uniref:Uncharacterized protein n=1 Tax=Roseibium salinum TaxID=1604349 RepID=A0ABT3R6U2_9HYPH|nr:hypothetical protein [Roseibium sp. DSM 29163]MCX2724796.1 hypothetical protein [Roseibium sp. DSM 29163]